MLKEVYTQPTVELKDRLNNKHCVEVYDNPSRLPDVIQAELVRELTPVTGRGFMRKDVWADDLAQDVACHVLGCDRLTVARSGGEVTAFVAASLKKMEGETIYHLEGVIVEPEYHNSGLGRQLIERDMAETQSSVLAFHTQSKKMLALGNKLAYLNNQDAVYYSRIINTRMLSVTESGLIVDHQRYGGNCLYGDINQFAQVAVEGIDWQQGDALVCAGRIK